MWKRRELKAKARKVVKSNYWTMLVVCFLIALLTGEFGTSIIGIWQSDDSMDPNYVINNEKLILNKLITEEEKEEIEKETIFNFDKEKVERILNDAQIKAMEAIDANLNSATKSQKYIFKIWDAINFFKLKLNVIGIELCLAAILAVAFTIFIADPLIVGGKKYFLKARMNKTTKVGVIIDIFRKENWINISIIMLLRNLYNALWYLTIIGGVIKTYEYRMIPYILAENPKVKRREAFELSKEMMKGNKLRTFALDVSFLGWDLLSVMTFGILKILYVNPYSATTNAELYMVLRNNAIEKKFNHYEVLNDKELK